MKKNFQNLVPLNKPGIKKLLLTMKLTLMIIFLSVLQVSANVYSQVFISLDAKGQTIREVLKSIEDQSKIRFFYSEDLLMMNDKMDIKADNENVLQVLNDIFSKSPLTYKAYDNNLIVIAPKELLQQQKVTGTITDSKTREPLIGVSIVVEGTTQGALTDTKGQFSIQVPGPASKLVFSFIGYESQKIEVGAKVLIDVALVPVTVSLEEVVVIGYGTQKKRDVTGSIASVSSKQLEKTKVSSIDQSIQGMASGVLVTQSNGNPGAPPAVQIRGASRFGSNEPLYVVDGVIIQGNLERYPQQPGGGYNPLAGINPDDIASIEVLKDAGAAAIYGARAGNGVIIVTTKKGKPGKLQVTLDASYGTQTVIKKLDIMNTTQNFQFSERQNGYKNIYDNPDSLTYEGIPYQKINTNWQDVILKNAPIQNFTLGISGGNESATYNISLGYLNQDGILIQSGFKRYTLRSVTDFKISKRISIGESINLSRGSQEDNSKQGVHFGYFGGTVFTPPFLSPYTTDPSYTGGYNGGTVWMGQLGSPLSLLLNSILDQRDRLLSNTNARIEIFNGLTYKLNIGLDLGSTLHETYTPAHYNGANASAVLSGLSEYSIYDRNILIENTLSYTRDFGKNHFDAVIGISQQKDNYHLYQVSTTIDNNIQTSFDAGSNGNKIIGGKKSDYLMSSQFGRINYNYAGKYLFSATLRRDGSSRFGPDKRWGVFPAFSAGWRISQESFLANVPLINDLKLYGSWGELGNDNVGNYLYSSTVQGAWPDPQGRTGGLIAYPFGDVLYNGQAPVQFGNSILQWESTKTTNFGLSGAILQNKISFEMEYYVKKTANLLLSSLPVPPSVGLIGAASNSATVRNKGMDFSLRYDGNAGAFNFSVTGNLSLYLENKILSLGDFNPTPIYGGNTATSNIGAFVTKSDIGGHVGDFYGLKFLGIWQEGDTAGIYRQPGAQPGDCKFAVGADGQLKPQVIGNPNPDYSFGVTLAVEYKGIDLSVFIQGVQGNDVYNSRLKVPGPYLTKFLDCWTPENKSNTLPRARSTYGRNYDISSFYIEDGSYTRIKNVQLGYTLPASILNRVKISKLRVYLTAQNLFTFTKYSGYDPELGEFSGRNVDRGIDIMSYPNSKEYRMGVQVTF